MRQLLFFSTVFLGLTACNNSDSVTTANAKQDSIKKMFQQTTFAQEKVIIGMTIKEVKKIYPAIKTDMNENGTTLSRPDNLYGLDDDWGYRFTGNKLTWIFFDKYINEINDGNFRKCLSATRQLVQDYTNLYGKPDTIIIGDTTFVDPFKKQHWGYDIIEAQWENYNNMKIKIEFTFMGGKGEYNFLVKICYFDKNYPYYD